MIPRILNWQGMAGIAVAFTLLVMLTVQKLETVHWKKQSESFEHLYQQEQAAFAITVAHARAAAEQARALDQANATRVATEQAAINERTEHDFEARLAAARSAAQRLQLDPHAATNPGAGRSSPVSGLSAAAGSAAQVSRENGLPAEDALIATEQAIQLDELIKWVRGQAAVDNNPKAVASPQGD